MNPTAGKSFQITLLQIRKYKQNKTTSHQIRQGFLLTALTKFSECKSDKRHSFKDINQEENNNLIHTIKFEEKGPSNSSPSHR